MSRAAARRGGGYAPAGVYEADAMRGIAGMLAPLGARARAAFALALSDQMVRWSLVRNPVAAGIVREVADHAGVPPPAGLRDGWRALPVGVPQSAAIAAEVGLRKLLDALRNDDRSQAAGLAIGAIYCILALAYCRVGYAGNAPPIPEEQGGIALRYREALAEEIAALRALASRCMETHPRESG